MKKLLITLAFAGFLSSCETMNDDPNEAPEITNSMDFDKAYDLAVKHGKDTLKSFKKRVRHNREWRKLQKRSSYELENKYKTMSVSKLQRVASLYHLITPEISPKILKNMLRSPDKGVRKIGLQIAGLKPSPSVAKVLENTLTLAILENREKDFYTEELAHAIANEVKSAYSFLKQGLITTGSEEFARALASLAPERAGYDFMEYIGQATVDDLRQLNQTSINVYTCIIIFRFFMDQGLPVAHPEAGKMFAFSISRNRALADMAVLLLESNIPSYRDEFSYILAKQPMSIQMAFIENVVRNPTTNIKLLLSDLKSVTAFSEVREEINSFRQL